MGEIIRIGDTDIAVKEWNGQRVVTFRDIDEAHKRVEGTAKRNFATNKDRFIEGEDYFVVTPQALENAEKYEKRTVENVVNSPRGTALITEQGYLMIVKSLNDDLAWKVQRELVNSYFRTRQIVSEELSPQTQALMQLVNQIAATEIEQKRMKEHIEKIEQTQDAIKEAVRPVFDNWRDEINKKVNRIQRACGAAFPALRVEMYKELDDRAGADVETRLNNRKERMRAEGHSKTAIEKLNRMDIIENDKKLREIFAKIVSEYEIKYCA